MSEPKWLDAYSGQTTAELIDLEEEYRTDSLVLAFEQALQQKVDRVGNDNLSDAERVVLAVEALEREVNSGGYSQFFFNSSNEFTPIVVHSLGAIGCSEVAELTQLAIDMLGINGPITVDAIDCVMENESDELEERLDVCDEQYYKVAGDLSGPLFEFIKANRDEITLGE